MPGKRERGNCAALSWGHCCEPPTCDLLALGSGETWVTPHGVLVAQGLLGSRRTPQWGPVLPCGVLGVLSPPSVLQT